MLARGSGSSYFLRMGLTRLVAKRFTAFHELDVTFGPGINVIIGPNSSGKSHLMKLAYGLARTLRTGELEHLGTRLERLFRPDDLGRLVWRAKGRRKAVVRGEFTTGACGFELSNLGRLETELERTDSKLHPVFLPSRELLAMYEGFIHAYENRELSFDETYFDGCVALSAAALRGARTEAVRKVTQPIEEALGGSVALVGARFYVSLPSGNLEAHLLSEGLRKIASLAQLIVSGSLPLNAHGILFWDEPEANLNPRLTVKVVEFLQAIARTGAQVILATHDHLLTQRLALAATYPEAGAAPIQFLGLRRSDDGEIKAEVAQHLADLGENPILDEFARFYDDQGAALRRAVEGR